MTTISNSTSAFYDRSAMDIADLRARAEAMQADLSRGQRIARSSDDPVGASRLRQLQRADATSTIDVANAAKASTNLQLTDTALASFADYVTHIQELTTQAANGTMTDAARASLGAEIGQIRDNMIQLANSRDAQGGALFGGQSAGDAYAVTAGVAGYVGTGSAGDLPLGDGQNVTRGLTGPEFLAFPAGGASPDLLAALKTLSDGLQAGGTAAQQAARDGLAALDQGMDQITTAQTVVGTRLAWVELTTERRTNLTEMRANEESDVGGTDIASTVARLQETMTVLEASQASFTKLASLSLFSLLN
ncbi:flagellar biosynthesis protein FlgL [Novosphingobium bradum]|uniref:Flagellar biosynthesis protein FlgL n=1 Tax=Novosphingobium bradum TaxID=1737444 RepID=A0ABV7IRS5_9SPHN